MSGEVKQTPMLVGALVVGVPVPRVIEDVGATAVVRFATFFTDNIRNPHTRRAYHRWIVTFYEHCRSHGLRFEDVKSYHVSAFIESLLQEGANPVTGKPYAKQSVKQALAAIP